MFAFVGARYYLTTSHMSNDLEVKAEHIAQRIAKAIQPTIWSVYQKPVDRIYSQKVTSAILDSEFSDPHVIGVSVYGNFGHVFMARYQNKQGQIVKYTPARHKTTLARTDKRSLISVRQGAMTIGNVLVLLSSDPDKKRLRDILLIEIAQVLLISLFFVTFLFYALRKVLIRPASELASANAELEEFSYRVTHDLRSPIVSSLALLKLSRKSLKKGYVDTTLLEMKHIIKSLEQLERLINDIFDILTIKNKTEQEEYVDVKGMIEETINVLSHLDGTSSLDVKYNLAFEKPLKTSPARLRMIIENLTSNAIKYQDKQEDLSFVKFTTRQETRQDKSLFILEIEDNGLGIPKKMHGEVFGMFKRFHPKVSFGSGLGLYLVKKSADFINAKIKFIALEKGSKFRISIPLRE